MESRKACRLCHAAGLLVFFAKRNWGLYFVKPTATEARRRLQRGAVRRPSSPDDTGRKSFFVWETAVKEALKLVGYASFHRVLASLVPGVALVFAVSSTPQVLSEEPLPPPPLVLQGHLQVNVNVETARVSLNGREVGTARMDSPLNIRNVTAGAMRVRVEAVGYAPVERVVEVPVGAWKQEAFILYPSESASSSPSVASAPPDEEPSLPASEVAEEAREPHQEEIATGRVPDTPQKAKAFYIEQAEAAKQAQRWAQAETYYERALEIDPQDNAVNAALFAVKEARWKEEGQSVVMLASSRMQLIMFTPYRSRFSMVPRQTRFFAVQVKVATADESALRYQWRVDDRPVSGREMYEFVNPAIGVHEISVTVEAPSGARLSKSWTVEVRKEEDEEATNGKGQTAKQYSRVPLYPPRVETFDVKDAIVSMDQKQLTVTGKVRNIDQDSAENVAVWVTALDSQGRPVLRRIGLPKPQPLGSKEVGVFSVSMENHPAIVRFHVESVSK